MKKFNIFLLMILCTIVLIPTESSAATFTSNWASTAPTIDGIVSGGDWNGAYLNVLTAYEVGPDTPNFVVNFRAMNDENKLYLRFDWIDLTYNSNLDVFIIYFDEHNDGNWSIPLLENGFAAMITNTTFTWTDGYVDFSSGIFTDVGSKDGEAAISWSGGGYILELSFPLGSSDTDDLQPGAGALIGIGLHWDTAEPSGKEYMYPLPLGASASFQLASPGIGSPIIFAFLVVGLVFAVSFTNWRKNQAELNI